MVLAAQRELAVATLDRHSRLLREVKAAMARIEDRSYGVLANDRTLLAAMLDRLGAQTPAQALTYAAAFRHARERETYERVMGVLDSGGDGPEVRLFAGNLASLGRLFSFVVDVQVTRSEQDLRTVELVRYTKSE